MNTPLSLKDVDGLFVASIENALKLINSAVLLVKNNFETVALGIAEISQEEIGKSYSCLAVYSISEKNSNWKLFWEEWKNHTIKAHRAYFYELFCTMRVEMSDSKEFFPTKRKSIPSEKEISFYVDFDHSERKIIEPFLEVENKEIGNRLASILGPLNTAKKIMDLFINKDYEYKSAFSDYARFTIQNKVYQQDVMKLLPKFKRGSRNYDQAIDDIFELFKFE